eukprot:GSMAST32.ASY1.ANO1.2049.1 assembled CDS
MEASLAAVFEAASSSHVGQLGYVGILFGGHWSPETRALAAICTKDTYNRLKDAALRSATTNTSFEMVSVRVPSKGCFDKQDCPDDRDGWNSFCYSLSWPSLPFEKENESVRLYNEYGNPNMQLPSLVLLDNNGKVWHEGSNIAKEALLTASSLRVKTKLKNLDPSPRATVLFISGNRSQIGKSTVCLGIIGSLLRKGFKASEIAYIKPATQCQKPTLISKFCQSNGIDCCPIGPILFYSGFTRKYLSGETKSSIEMLQDVHNKVNLYAKTPERKFVIVDGVVRFHYEF